MHRINAVFLLAAFTAALSGTPLFATVIPPIGLAPGSQYQLVFVTADAIVGSYGTEAPYNAFANAEAALNSSLPSATWSAITSTADGASANVNAPWLGLPVYNTAGYQVSLPGSFYGNFLNSLIGWDQFGISGGTGTVWTGSSPAGANQNPLGLAFAQVGNSNFFGPEWAQIDYLHTTSEFSIYALSGAITLAVPEPATLTLLGSALLLFGGRQLLGRRRRA
jgi:hypothetical protein